MDMGVSGGQLDDGNAIALPQQSRGRSTSLLPAHTRKWRISNGNEMSVNGKATSVPPLASISRTFPASAALQQFSRLQSAQTAPLPLSIQKSAKTRASNGTRGIRHFCRLEFPVPPAGPLF
jgi:hypothetical protein